MLSETEERQLLARMMDLTAECLDAGTTTQTAAKKLRQAATRLRSEADVLQRLKDAAIQKKWDDKTGQAYPARGDEKTYTPGVTKVHEVSEDGGRSWLPGGTSAEQQG